MAQLKVKVFDLYAGKPIAILNREFAEEASIHVDDRIFLMKRNKRVVAIVDIAEKKKKKNQVAVSSEVTKEMKLKSGEKVEIEIAPKPESLEFIQKKLSGQKLTKKEYKKIMQDVISNNLTGAEIAYFISAIYKSGMSIKETRDMIKAIVETGKTLKLRGKIADKHSIGGVPGRTTPIIVSICAAAGLKIPKTSSRAITTSAGTADAMETICKVDFSIQDIKRILEKVGACIVWGGALNLAPADDKLIKIEKLLNLDPEEQLLASILSKKISVDAGYIVIDMPYGKNAKIDLKEARSLEKKFKKLAKYFGIKIDVSKKRTEEPLGNGIGPALEIQDAIKVLKRESSCYKLEERALELSGILLEITGKAKKGNGYKKAKKILDSGKAWKKFKEIVKAQKGNIKRIKEAKYKDDLKSEKTGNIREIKIKQINQIARNAGCPLDKYAGIYLHKHVGDRVKKGEKLLTIYAESKTELKNAKKEYKRLNPIIIRRW